MVWQIPATIFGGAILAGMNLLEIASFDCTLLDERLVRLARATFPRPTPEANAGYTDFVYTAYTGLSAKLGHISADSITVERMTVIT